MAQDLGTSFKSFLLAWGEDTLAAMSSPLSVPFTVLAIIVPSAWANATLSAIAALCVVFAAYRV